MKNILTSIIILFIGTSSLAQLKQLTMEEAMLSARTTLAPENLKQLQFIKGSNDYVYIKKLNGVDTWVKSGFADTKETTMLTLTTLNLYLKNASMDTVSTMPPIQFSNDGFTATIQNQKLLFTSGKLDRVLIDKEVLSKENVDESSADFIAYLNKHNLYVTKNGNAIKVTDDGSENIVYASTVHQSEFGITKGTFWSNNGKCLAFYRMDQTMVPDYPIIDWSVRPAKANYIKYPMAGDPSHHVKLGIYHTEKNKTVWINTAGPEEQYLTNIAWSPDDHFVFIVILNRDQNHFWVNQYDANTGELVKTLFEEEDKKYVEPLVPMLFVKNNPKQFIWQSKRDGWNHLYLYNADGTLEKQLTKGDWDVLEVKGFDKKGEQLYYVSTQVSPISKNLYKVNLKTQKISAITTGNSIHNTSINTDGTYVIDNFSSPENPRTIRIIETTGMKSKPLIQSKNPLSNYEQSDMSIFTLKNAEGTDLYCRLFKPTHFDSTKKYPVVVYWYGGPHAQLVLNGWNGGAGDYWFQYRAERGYVVFTIDTRGSANRGKNFEQSIFRIAGDKQMEDLMTGVNYLKKLSYTDSKNMGLFGWSYGGFLTINFMLTYPDVYQAAVAGGPVTDWKFYEIMYTERYMDRPDENPEGYEKTNLSNRINSLKGRLLLIHGMQDNVVLMQHSVNLVKSAVDDNIQIYYMIYPGHEHNVLGKDRVHLYQKVTNYFTHNLR